MSDELVIERLRKKLEKENKSMSTFVAEAAAEYLDVQARPGEIELEGFGAKRIFTGTELYWHTDSDSERGVFLTAKGAIAYWSFVPRAINEDKAESFEVYASLAEFFDENDWLNEREQSAMKSEIQRKYVAVTKRRLVERLDI